MNRDKKNILIIGMAGGLAKLTAKQLLISFPDSTIHGIDSRPLQGFEEQKNFTFQKIKYTRGNFEKLFREERFDTVYHLARMSHAATGKKAEIAKRLNLNLMGTTRILELCHKYEVKNVIIMSTFHVYGALVDNPVFIKEDGPLRASIKYPELRDVTEMDQIATSWMWKHQKEIKTVVLRPSNIIGPTINNTMTQYLRALYAPIAIDFNPMFQFIYEEDMAKILTQCLEKVPTGVYNIASDEVISMHAAKKLLKTDNVKIPLTLLEPAAKLIKAVWSFPDYLLDYLKFASIIDGSLIRPHLNEKNFEYSLQESLELISKTNDPKEN